MIIFYHNGDSSFCALLCVTYNISIHYLMHESNTISVIEIAVTMGMEALGIARDTTCHVPVLRS